MPTLEELLGELGISEAEKAPTYEEFRRLLENWYLRLAYEGGLTTKQANALIEGARNTLPQMQARGMPIQQHPDYALLTEKSDYRRKVYIKTFKTRQRVEEERKATEKERLLGEEYYRVYATPEEMKEQARARQAWAGREAEPKVPTGAPPPSLPMAGAEAVYPYLEQMPGGRAGAMGRYIESQLGQIYSEFEQKFPGARASWFRTLHEPTPEEPTTEEIAGTTGIPAGQLPYMQEWLGGEEAYRERYGEPTLAWKQKAGGAAQALMTGDAPAPPTPVDPWETFLGQYSFLGKYYAQPPQQRGFYPGRQAGRAKWYV